MKVGVLGGGQLGQMIALAGVPLGIDVTCYDTNSSVAASHGGNLVVGEFNDLDKLRAWAGQCDIVTYEWENVPVELISDLSSVTGVRPRANALAVAQDRWREKRLLSDLDIPLAPFRLCTNEEEVRKAMVELGPTVVFKTRTGGYDGKGQAVINEGEDLGPALALLDSSEIVAEQFIRFDFESSIIAARTSRGHVVTYPTTLNVHRGGILRTSIVGSGLSNAQQAEAAKYMTLLMSELEYVGVMTLELFSANGRLLANEIAPRVHNSGHWTIEGSETSQFENHLRAICGLPLGSTAARCAAAMVNIIGTPPDALKVLDIEGAALHTYRKSSRPGRKLGHVTVTAPSERELMNRLQVVEALVAP